MTFYLESLGCAKNQVESELIIERLRRAGFTPSAEAGGADVILVNTCGFIEEAKQQSINTALDFRREYPRKKIVLTGCLAVRYAQELRESLTEVDGVYEKPDTAGLAAWLGEVCGFTCYGLAGSSQAVPSQTAAPEATRPLLSPAGSAYVRVADGCDNGCSFCAIPLIRGRLRSRGADEVAAECQALLARGVKEICLVAQDLAAYGRDRAGESRLASLLERITRIQGDFWIRLLYLHPDHFPYEILPVAQADTRILPYFDLPFQHASPKVLRAMNRRGGSEQYQTLIKTIRGALPGAAIRSTFLCGFPGETEEDFQVLLDFQQAAALTWIGCFRYSPEEGTPAAAHAATLGAVPSRKTAARRQEALERAQVPITARFLDALLDRQATVLVEAAAEAGAGVLVNAEENLYLGRLACSAPDVDGGVIIQTRNTLTPGTFARGVIRGRSGFDLLVAMPSVCGNGKGAGG